jgi:3-dehydroquinate synthase
MRVIDVEVQSNSYQIFIGCDIAFKMLKDFLDRSTYSSVLIITDDNLESLYGYNVLNYLNAKGYNAFIYIINSGEQSKSIEVASQIWSFCLEQGIDRSSAIIALGGGVVGDLGGFVASTYMRGIDYIQMPTSLMAMVDSSVGGKVAINLGNIKNIVGSFYQPKVVIIDTAFLKTLPRIQLLSGLGEIIKYALIADYEFFTYIKSSYKDILAMNSKELLYIIELCCKLKAEIVSKDERENNLRVILNLGHTIGHGIESVLGMNRITHGEAVAMGIVYESKIALEMGIINKKYYNEIIDIVKLLGLFRPIEIDIKQFMSAVYKDKKNLGKSIRLVLPVDAGKVEICDNIDDNIIKKSIEEGFGSE